MSKVKSWLQRSKKWLRNTAAAMVLLAILAIVVLLVLSRIDSCATSEDVGADATTTTAATTTPTTAPVSIVEDAVTDAEPWRAVADDVSGEFPFYYAQTPGLPSGYFGPAVHTSSVEEALTELHVTMCLDPFIAASVVEGLRGNLQDLDAITATKELYLQDRDAWSMDVYWAEQVIAGQKLLPDGQTFVVNVGIVDLRVTEAWTQIAILRPGQSPLVDWEKEFKGHYRALRFTFSDSAWLDLQLDCHFQPTYFTKGTTVTTSTTTTQTTLPPKDEPDEEQGGDIPPMPPPGV
jgi:hypothetical protein